MTVPYRCIQGADLRGANLSRANLQGANLTGAFLSDVSPCLRQIVELLQL